MSSALMPRRASISRRIASLQGSAPKMPISSVPPRSPAPSRSDDFRDVERIRRRRAQHACAEIPDQQHLALGRAARHRHDRRAEALGAVVRAQAAGEKAVAVGVVHHVARAHAGAGERARHQARPGRDVAAV